MLNPKKSFLLEGKTMSTRNQPMKRPPMSEPTYSKTETTTEVFPLKNPSPIPSEGREVFLAQSLPKLPEKPIT